MTGSLALLLSVATGVLVGVTGLRTEELQGPGGVLFAAAFFLAAWQPDGAWRRGLMLGLSVPMAQIVSQLSGQALPYTVGNPYATLLAIIPAMLGTLVGIAVSRLRHHDGPAPKYEPPR